MSPPFAAHLHQAGARRVVLDLMAAGGIVGAGLVDHHDRVVAAGLRARALADAGDLRYVIELDRRDQPFPVLHADARLAQHVHAAVGAARPPDPGAGRAGELPVVVLLGVLAEVPHVPRVVLGEERELLLLQLPLEVVLVQCHHRLGAVDVLDQVGHGEDHAVLVRAVGVDDLALVGELGADSQREQRVGDGERRGERAARGLRHAAAGPWGWPSRRRRAGGGGGGLVRAARCPRTRPAGRRRAARHRPGRPWPAAAGRGGWIVGRCGSIMCLLRFLAVAAVPPGGGDRTSGTATGR